MKKIAIFILFLIFIVSQLYAKSSKNKEKTEVSIILEEKKELLPDTFALGLNITTLMDTEVQAINVIGKVDKILRKLNLNYKGGKYWVYQNCWWKKNKKKCSGYKATVEYVFLLKEPSFQNKIFKILERFKEKYRKNFNFKVYKTEWIVSERKITHVKDKLRLIIIEKAKNFSAKVSSALGKNCDIKSIDYNLRILPPHYFFATKAVENTAIEAPEPKREEKTVSIKARVKLSCK